MKYIKTYETLNRKVYGYNVRFWKRDVINAEVIYKNYKFPKKIKNLDIDPYGEEDWGDGNKKLDLNDIPKGYFNHDLKNFISANKKDYPYVIEFNTCGYMGCDVPRTYTKFIVDENVVEGLKDPKCIGFNTDAPEIRNETPENIIYQDGVWKLIPIYQKEYIYEYDEDFPLSHLIETREPLKIEKEDWNKFVEIINRKNYRWPRYEEYGIPKRSEIKKENSVNLFKKQDFIFVSVYDNFITASHSISRLDKYYVNFKDILNKTAKYIEK